MHGLVVEDITEAGVLHFITMLKRGRGNTDGLGGINGGLILPA